MEDQPPTYSVTRWDECYENNRTRGMVVMQWIPVPNSHDGDGYIELVSRKNGAAYLGAWLAILQVASKCSTRGTLVRRNGKPHTAKSIAKITRLDEKIVADTLQILASEDVAWLCQAGGTLPAPSAHPTDEEGRKEEKEAGASVYPSDFEEFWQAYPKKKGKGAALKAWKATKSIRPETFKLVLVVGKLSESHDWTKDGGKWVPNPATWLNAHGWADELPLGGRSIRGENFNSDGTAKLVC